MSRSPFAPEPGQYENNLYMNVFKKGSGKIRAVQGSSQKCGPSVRFRVREGEFLAMTQQCAGEF